MTAEQAQAIERATQQQSDSPDCYRHRRLRVTASNFGRIARRRDSTPVANLIKSLLYSKPVNAPSLRWGTKHEHDARKAYLQEMTIRGCSGVRTIPSNLVIATSDSCLGCSRDDICCASLWRAGLGGVQVPLQGCKGEPYPRKSCC